MVKSGCVALLGLLLCAGASAAQTSAPNGNIEDGKKAWGVAPRCQNCHGAQAEGGFGPDLAGRGLSFDQFRQAVRRPWGVMLGYTEKQLSDQTLADMYAYTSSLHQVAQPGKAHFTAPPGAPLGQVYLVDTIGCAHCHEPELRQPRRVLGGEATDVDFEFFAKRIYQHQEFYPTGRMGNYTKARVPEVILRELFRWVEDDLGLLVPIQAVLDLAGTPNGANTTYTLTVRNAGAPGKGLTAEDVTVSLKLPAGAKVVTTTGAGLQGVTADAAVWKLAKIAPKDELKYTVTLAGAPSAPGPLFKGSRVDWMKPAMRIGGPTLQLVDERWMGSKNDWQPVGVAAPPPPPAPPVQ